MYARTLKRIRQNSIGYKRATLAEKEVTTLKEQLNSNTTSNNCENKDTSNMDRQSFETEIAAKDKEEAGPKRSPGPQTPLPPFP
nr:unnamed protein product [Callosobruchus analis]